MFEQIAESVSLVPGKFATMLQQRISQYKPVYLNFLKIKCFGTVWEYKLTNAKMLSRNK
jgi:hypothetical protein